VLLRVADPPFNSGHLVLFPRRHVGHAAALLPDERRALAEGLQRGERLIARVYGGEALNVGWNSGTGEHLAVQIVPRWAGDLNFLPLVAQLKLIPETPRRTWERLREEMR
jgi:ATP adenylyltransferase